MTASIDEQLGWTRATALVVRAPERCVLEVTGADRLSWLNGLLTCQLASRSVGEAVMGLAVAQKGKIVSEVVVLVEATRVLLVVQRSKADALVASFERHLMMEDAELTRAEGEVWFAHGPRSREVLALVPGASGGAVDVTGSGGAVLVVRGDGADVEQAARSVGGGVGDEAGWEVVRVLAGVPRFGVDFDDGNYPQEAALEAKAVSFDKGCYLGQEVVCMLEMRGHVKKKLVSLAIDGADSPAAHTPVEDGKGSVGEVTTVVRAPDGSVHALAMVKYAVIAKGTELAVGGHAARVV